MDYYKEGESSKCAHPLTLRLKNKNGLGILHRGSRLYTYRPPTTSRTRRYRQT